MTQIDQTKNQIPLSRRFSALCSQLNNGRWSDLYDIEAGALVQQVREKLEGVTHLDIALDTNPAEDYLPVLTAIAQHTLTGQRLLSDFSPRTILYYTAGRSQPSVFVSRRLVIQLKEVVEKEIADFARAAIHRTPYLGYSPANTII